MSSTIEQDDYSTTKCKRANKTNTRFLDNIFQHVMKCQNLR